jgi:hypothetical protein
MTCLEQNTSCDKSKILQENKFQKKEGKRERGKEKGKEQVRERL